MKDNDRRCAKCMRSTAELPGLKLFRFPKPGRFNIERSRIWARYCYPDQEWESVEFQKQLFSGHKMLCQYHFKETDFTDYSAKKLNRYSAPSDPEVHASIPTAVSHPVEDPTCSIPPSQQQPDLPQSGAYTQEATTSSKQTATQRQPVIPRTATQSFRTSREQALYNKCRRQLRTICKMRRQYRKLSKDCLLESIRSDKNIELLSENLTDQFAVLLQGQLINCKRSPKGRRWNLNQKLIAVQLYKRSPSCYRLLRRLFSLPSQSTLKALINHIPLKPGINMQIFDTLKSVTRKETDEKNECVLMFDEMAIRKNIQYDKKNDLIAGYQDHGEQGRSAELASYALVFMIAGIRKKFKQPVAYYLSGASVTADRLTVLIKEVLGQCLKAGLNVSETVCDMAATNRKAMTNLGATTNHPYFIYDQREIVSLYDPPHLLKCFRNLFMKYDVKCNLGVQIGDQGSSTNNRTQGIAKWEHIKQFYAIDKMNPCFVFAPALSDDHLNPNTKQKMKVRLAAQVLSHSVAAGMYAKVGTGELKAEVLPTVNLIKSIDCLFDTLNADTPDLRRGKIYSTNLSNSSQHIKFWNEIVPVFETMQFIGAKERPPSQNGWIQTIKGVQRLWNTLRQKYPDRVHSLATRRLQQDALENCFGCIRGYCGSNTNPNCTQFVAALKSAIINNMTKMSSGTNCEDDNSPLLTNLNSYLRHSTPAHRPDAETSTHQNNSYNTDNILDENISDETLLSETQACAYVSGFIQKRMLRDLQCEICEQQLKAESQTLSHMFIYFKEYREDKTQLKYPSEKFIECVEHLSGLTNNFLTMNSHINELKKKLCMSLQPDSSLDFLNCNLHRDEIRNRTIDSVFYICVKRYCVLTNRSTTKESNKEQLKKKIRLLQHK